MAQHRTHIKKVKEDWMQTRWRPAMGWMYMAICMFDFMIAPILWSLLQSRNHGVINVQWQPLTLQGAGLFHLAMGAVLGIAAYGRTQEKMTGTHSNNTDGEFAAGFGAGAGTTYMPPGAVPGQLNNNNNGFGGMNNAGFNTLSSGPSTFGAMPAAGFGSNNNFAAGTTSTAPSSFGSSSFGSTASATPAVNVRGQKVIPAQQDPVL